MEQLDSLPPVYFSNECDVVKCLFTPVAISSHEFICMSGYFSSNALRELAEPLAILFKNPTAKGRFVISPNLSEADKEALLEAYQSDESFFSVIFRGDTGLREELEHATLNAMKYLISKGKLDFRIAIMKEGMMHAKYWVFDTPSGAVSVHGSGNATKSGLMRNFEQLVFTRAWESEAARMTIEQYEQRFEAFWKGNRQDSFTLRLNDKTIEDIVRSTSENMTDSKLEEILAKLEKAERDMSLAKLAVPEWLNYQDGEYSHQGDAVKAWLEKRKGILEIATGGGKTLTSLVCASLSLKDEESALLVIAVPTKPLVKQWGEDVINFSVEPYLTDGVSTKEIVKTISSINKKHRFMPGHDVIVITHDALKNESITRVLGKYKHRLMLIADEVHNLGVDAFFEKEIDIFDDRLGLSATPVRQYDQEGTNKLVEYFGEIVFKFSLEDAIGKCLVPFKYYVHTCPLNDEEIDDWEELTEKIKAISWDDSEESKKLIEHYLIRRRAISESAASKIEIFRSVLKNASDKKYSLVFCTSKGPEQLEAVNEVLQEEKCIYHQITGVETGNKRLMTDIVEAYKKGNVDILTSKKVLDEGFNIPAIKNAYFLASSGTVRTWVQRLGRVLRISKETNKECAEVHDFAVFPIELSTSMKGLLKNELDRIQWFASLSMNGTEVGGAMDVVSEYIDAMERL